MLLHLAALLVPFLSSLSTAIGIRSPDKNYRDVLSGNLIDDATNITIVKNGDWPATLPHFYRSSHIYPDTKVRLVLSGYGHDLPSDPDWQAFLYDAYTKLKADIKVNYGDEGDVDKEIEAMGGNHRIYWEFVPGVVSVKGKIAIDLIDMIYDLYEGRSIRETVFLIQLDGQNAAKLTLSRGRGPGPTVTTANITVD